jgi:hypothetical protein
VTTRSQPRRPKSRMAHTSKRIATGAAVTITAGVVTFLALAEQSAISAPADAVLVVESGATVVSGATAVTLAPTVVVVRRVHYITDETARISDQPPTPTPTHHGFAPKPATKSSVASVGVKPRAKGDRVAKVRTVRPGAKRTPKPRTVRTKAS